MAQQGAVIVGADRYWLCLLLGGGWPLIFFEGVWCHLNKGPIKRHEAAVLHSQESR
jgi:hypothetical protein